MFKEYDKNTYKEKEVKDRTPFRTAFKKIWNDVNVWRVLLFMVVALIWFLGFSLKTNAAENDLVDEEYMASKLGDYKYQVIVKNESEEYFVLASNLPILYEVPTDNSLSYFWSTKGSSKSFARELQIVDGKLQYSALFGMTFDSTTQSINFNAARVTNSHNIIYWSNNDVYSTDGTLIYSINPVTDTDTSTGIIVSTDLTEVLTFLDEILVCLKAIFSTLSIILFFLVAEWTANKVKNIVRRFSRYE